MNISIRGVEIMNDDPSSVNILYAKVESEALQQIGDGILRRFIDAGNLMQHNDHNQHSLPMFPFQFQTTFRFGKA